MYLHCPCFHGVADGDGAVDVLGEDAALQSHVVLVAVLHRLLDAVHTNDGQDGAERLLPGNAHVWSHMVEQSGPQQVALPLVFCQKLGPWVAS